MTIRKLSIVLWIVAAVTGFWLMTRKPPPPHVALMVVVPSGDFMLDKKAALDTALDDELGQQGLSPELRVITRRQDVPDEQAETRRLGFPPVQRLLCGVVEYDGGEQPIRLVAMFEVYDVDKAARGAVAAAMKWSE